MDTEKNKCSYGPKGTATAILMARANFYVIISLSFSLFSKLVFDAK